MRECLKLLATILIVSWAVVAAPAQAPIAVVKNQVNSPDYSKESFIIEKERTTASFEDSGLATRAGSAEVRVQSEAGVQKWGLLSFGYNAANEELAIGYVRVRKADGTAVETPPESVQDVTSEVTRLAPMYSDYHEKHVAVKGLGVGDTLEFQVTTRIRTPLIPGQFWFAYDFEKTGVVLDEEVEISVPKDREVKVKSPDLTPAVREEGSRRVYAWKTANRESKEVEEPVREQPVPGILVSTFKTWEDLGRWWEGLEQPRVTPTPEIRAKAAELTQDAKTYDDKVRALYSYVATHFRYISISFGLGRYEPHAAGEVFRNEYGDCKDKHTLLSSLLQAVEIEAYPALINSARKVDPDVPSPGQFDHVITVVRQSPGGDKLTWLDTTTEVAPFGFLYFTLRDKQALVIPSAQPALLVTTPADPPFKSFQSYEINAKLSDTGVLEGKVERIFRGDTEVMLRLAFRQAPQSRWKDVVQRISQAVGFAGDVSEVQVDAPEATSEPFHISYKYTRKDYPDWANHRISPPVGFVFFPEVKDDPKRTQPILLGPRDENIAVAKVELPKGYTSRLLQGVDLVRDFAEYHSKYAFKDGVFTTEERVVIKKREVPLSAVDDYKSFQKAVTEDWSRYTEMTGASTPVYVPTPSSNAEATSLVEQAREAFQRRDLDGASDSLERALKLDDRYKDAWLMLGSLRFIQGRTGEGFKALRKAVDLDPKDSQAYKALASAFMSMRRPEEAIPVWRDLLKQDPNEKDARANLGMILLGLKRYSEAVPELEAAVALNKPSTSLALALAQAYVAVGNNDKAVATFKKLGETALTPATWNEVAYALADHNLELPDAERYAQKAVKSIEDEAAQVSLEKLEVADLNRIPQLAYYWDTLGWVYFREGDLDKAQRYLEAAWNLEQNRVIGGHLADIYEKQGKKSAASHQKALAHELTDSGGFGPILQRRDGTPVPPAPGRQTAVEELSAMRRTKLGKLTTKSGSAEFFILLAPGGRVEDVKFISGDDHIRPLSKVLTSLKFKAPLPDGAPVRLVRRGVLVCTGLFGCDFTLFIPDTVQSIN